MGRAHFFRAVQGSPHPPNAAILAVRVAAPGNPATEAKVKYARAVFYGMVLWAIPFAVALAIFMLREANRPLFESIMAVTVAAVCLALALHYFRKIEAPTLAHGVVLGVAWWAISIVIDLPLMLFPPIAMSLPEYLSDVGVTYLMYPAITGAIVAARRQS